MPAFAKGLRERFGARLEKALILLPTRRAVRALGDALVGESGAAILPRLRPLADIDPEEPPFEPGELGLLVKPAIASLQRRFELARLVFAFHHRTSDLPLDMDGALALVDPLLQILDDADMEEVSPERLSGLREISEFAAQHFQNAAVFYEILQTHWPRRLKELDVMSPMARRVAVLNALTDLWQSEPPTHPVIIAGSTGTLKATTRLMQCVAGLAEGLIVLPGLDTSLRATAWDKVGVEHPQGALKNLITALGRSHRDIPNWPVLDTASARARRRLISESLVPVEETDDWPSRIQTLKQETATDDGEQSGDDRFKRGLDGLSLITTDTGESEAQTIAVILRETLETPHQTAALITPDPALARRVRAVLRRWHVDVDYSQGEPLEETSLGTFLMRCLEAAQSLTDTANPYETSMSSDTQDYAKHLSPLAFAALCKHPLFALGRPVGYNRQAWEIVEKNGFRATRLKEKKNGYKSAAPFLDKMITAFSPFQKCGETALAPAWAQSLGQIAEHLATTDQRSGAERLWREDAGEQAATLLENILSYGDILGEMSLEVFSRLFAKLMRGKAVRPRYGTHPRLQILGPLEARMLSADVIILGGLNEGIWPASPKQAPFLSRVMRQKLGLSLPERRYGLAAHDFAGLAAHKRVIMTRAHRSAEGPMVASRWIWRLQTLVAGALGPDNTALDPEKPYKIWAQALDDVDPADVTPALSPQPSPPLEARWPHQKRQLSITQIKTWIRDPYSIYARYVLGLKRLDAIEKDVGTREFGSALHKGLETFMERHKTQLTQSADKSLVDAFQSALGEAGFADYEISKERSRLVAIAAEFTAWVRLRREDGWQVAGLEAYGHIYMEDVDFTLSGIADLIEIGPLGYSIVDYKTGTPATIKEVKAGFDPQLPLTAYLLAHGGVKGLKPRRSEDLIYLRLNGIGTSGDMVKPLTPNKAMSSRAVKEALSAVEYTEQSIAALKTLITEFDKVGTIYHSQPRAKYTHDYGDYDDLARRGEWARLAGGEDGV